MSVTVLIVDDHPSFRASARARRGRRIARARPDEQPRGLAGRARSTDRCARPRLRRQRPHRARPPPGQPDRRADGGGRVPVVPERPCRGEQRLGLHPRRRADVPRLPGVRPSLPRVPERAAGVEARAWRRAGCVRRRDRRAAAAPVLHEAPGRSGEPRLRRLSAKRPPPPRQPLHVGGDRLRTAQYRDRADRARALPARAALREEPNVLQAIAGAARIALERDQLLVKDRARAERYRALLGAMPDLMFRISRDGRYLGYSAPSDTQLLHPQVVGLTVWERLPPELADRIMAASRRAFAEAQPQTLEYDLDFGSGDVRSYEGRVAAAGDDEFLFIVREITDRKRQQRELEASRARIVAAQDDARRRLERNLHDGAQQRLVSLSLSLRLAQGQLRSDPDVAAELLESSREELALALEELRELARGVHPAVLTDRGLHEALEALAARAPLPVELDVPQQRLPLQVEAAAYYVVSEALANVTKYAQARSVRVQVAQQDGSASVEVADDGVGGADPERGSGLRGLADRVAALQGTLAVDSPPGAGTCIRAEIPL